MNKNNMSADQSPLPTAQDSPPASKNRHLGVCIFADEGHFTAVHNLAIEELMPHLSGNAWKLLCFILRQTNGYKREDRELSYAQIRRGTGIKSDATVVSALQELLDYSAAATPERAIILREMGRPCGVARSERTRYSLNPKFMVAIPFKEQPTELACLPNVKPRRALKTKAHRKLQSGVEPWFQTPHFLAVCEACCMDIRIITRKAKLEIQEVGEILQSVGYSPEEIREAGELWALPMAPLPYQLLDTIQAVLNSKTRLNSGLYPTTQHKTSDGYVTMRDIEEVMKTSEELAERRRQLEVRLRAAQQKKYPSEATEPKKPASDPFDIFYRR